MLLKTATKLKISRKALDFSLTIICFGRQYMYEITKEPNQSLIFIIITYKKSHLKLSTS